MRILLVGLVACGGFTSRSKGIDPAVQVGTPANVVTMLPPDTTVVRGMSAIPSTPAYTLAPDTTRRDLTAVPQLITNPNAIDISPDGQFIATTGTLGGVVVWDVRTQLALYVFQADAGSIRFSPDGRYLIANRVDSGRGDDSTEAALTQIWDLRAGKLIFEAPGRGLTMSAAGHCAIVSVGNGKLTVFDVAAGKLLRSAPLNLEWEAEGGHAWSDQAAISPDGSKIVVLEVRASKSIADGTLFDGKTLAQIGERGALEQVKILRFGKEPLVGSGQDCMTSNGFTSLPDDPKALGAIYPKGYHYEGWITRCVATDAWFALSEHERLSLWDRKSGERLASFGGKVGLESYLVFGNTPSQLVTLTAARDNGQHALLNTWDLATGRIVRSIDLGDQQRFYGLARSPSGKRYYAYGDYSDSDPQHNNVFVIDAASGAVLKLVSGEQETTGFAVSPDGQRFYTINATGHAFEWNANTFERVRSLPDGAVQASLSLDPSGRYLAISSVQAGSMVDLTTGQVSGGAPNGRAYFTPDGLWSIGVQHHDRNDIEFWPFANGNVGTAIKLKMTGRPTRAAFSPDGATLATANAAGRVALWDWRARKQLVEFELSESRILKLEFSPDGHFLLASAMNSEAIVWDLRAGKRVAQLNSVGGEGLITTPSGYYLAPKSALAAQAFRVDGRAYPLEQFELRFNRPDLVLGALGYAAPAQIQAYAANVKARMKKNGLNPDSVEQVRLPLLQVTSQVPTTAKSRLSARVRATANGSPIKALMVYVNDVPIHGMRGTAVTENDLMVPLASGRNKVQFSAIANDGGESLRSTFYVENTVAAKAVKTWVLAVGVSNYRDQNYALAYAAKDATDLIATFKTLGPVESLALLDGAVTREGISKAKSFFAKAAPDDKAILFVAGHGLVTDSGEYYYATADIDFARPNKRGLPFADIEALLDGIPAYNKLMLVDTCHAGEQDDAEQIAAVSAPSSGVKMRGLKSKKAATTAVRASGLAQQSLTDVRRGTGANIIAASSGAQFSFEDATIKNGMFTHAVIEGLMTRKADKNADANVRVGELRDYVSEVVSRMTGGAQTPTTRRENLSNDFFLR